MEGVFFFLNGPYLKKKHPGNLTFWNPKNEGLVQMFFPFQMGENLKVPAVITNL